MEETGREILISSHDDGDEDEQLQPAASIRHPSKGAGGPAVTTSNIPTTTTISAPSTILLRESVQKTSASTATTTNHTPISPVLSKGLLSTTSGDTSQNSTTCSVGRGSQSQSTKLMYVNEKFASSRPSSSSNMANKSKSRKMQRDQPPLPSPPTPTTSSNTITNVHSSPSTASLNHSSANVAQSSIGFSERALKHHSFVSEVPDVRHMERALLNLLDDFHSGKLRAFGSGCTMDQMTDIREQQERLARLHFELGSHSRGLVSDDSGEVTAQENMTRLVKKLEQLSVSIERLHSSNSDL